MRFVDRGCCGRVVLLTWLALGATACGGGGNGSERVCMTIGTDGGLVQSDDDILTIALRPGALEEDTEICVRRDDEPPDVLGPAYRVSPNIPLAVTSTITYRHPLPAESSNVTVGKVERAAYEAGMGDWIPLPQLVVDAEHELVKSSDDEIALFYALLDDAGTASDSSESDDNATAEDATMTAEGAESDTTGGETTTGTAGTTEGSTTEPITTGPIETTDDGPVEESSSDDASEDTGTVYPPECDDIFRGPYMEVYDGPIVGSPGSEDLAMNGEDFFVLREGTILTEVHDGAVTMPYMLDAPLGGTTLGLRFRADGDLVAAQYDSGELLLIHPDGSVDPFFDMLEGPNGIYPDADGNVWVTEYGGQRVRRIDPDCDDDTIITQGMATASGANGIVYDDLRQIVFWTKYDDSELWSAPIADDGTPGAPVMVTDLEGHSDGLALDICGNIYAVDEGGGLMNVSRIDRVFLDESGAFVEIEELAGAGDINGAVANVQFAYGDGFAYGEAIYAVGVPGSLYVLDIQMTGHPIAASGG